jgi:hypothetical protein
MLVGFYYCVFGSINCSNGTIVVNGADIRHLDYPVQWPALKRFIALTDKLMNRLPE